MSIREIAFPEPEISSKLGGARAAMATYIAHIYRVSVCTSLCTRTAAGPDTRWLLYRYRVCPTPAR